MPSWRVCPRTSCHTGIHPLSCHIDRYLSFDLQADEDAFLEGVRAHGRDAKLIARDMGNRTIGAVKKFYQKNRKCACLCCNLSLQCVMVQCRLQPCTGTALLRRLVC